MNKEADSPRGSIALSSSPVCYRRVKDKRPSPPCTVMDLQVFQFQAKSSLKKCPDSRKNQERIFVAGDSVGILMNFDPFEYQGEVWFIVTKFRSGTKRLWRRQWSELRGKLATTPQICIEEVPVCEVGTVGEEAKVAHCLHVHSTECFCVKIGDGSRQNTLWVEVGLFNTRFVGTEEDYLETVKNFPTYFPVANSLPLPIMVSPTDSENESDEATITTTSTTAAVVAADRFKSASDDDNDDDDDDDSDNNITLPSFPAFIAETTARC